MSKSQVTVWVQKFEDQDELMFQWIDPFTGERKSKSAETKNFAIAEMRRTLFEHELRKLGPPAFFVGGHLALDFLNTTATPRGRRVEWLGDGQNLVDWLEQAGAIEPAAARISEWGSDALDEVARQAREFRQWLRGFVTPRMGKPLRATAAAVSSLNELLAGDNSFQRVETAGRAAEDGRRLLLRRIHRWENPGELLQPIAQAAADLICNQDFRLMRSCEGSACTLLFLDRTKAHSRRWCSMAVCGNRAKAAAHRARRSAE